MEIFTCIDFRMGHHKWRQGGKVFELKEVKTKETERIFIFKFCASFIRPSCSLSSFIQIWRWREPVQWPMGEKDYTQRFSYVLGTSLNFRSKIKFLGSMYSLHFVFVCPFPHFDFIFNFCRPNGQSPGLSSAGVDQTLNSYSD